MSVLTKIFFSFIILLSFVGPAYSGSEDFNENSIKRLDVPIAIYCADNDVFKTLVSNKQLEIKAVVKSESTETIVAYSNVNKILYLITLGIDENKVCWTFLVKNSELIDKK